VWGVVGVVAQVAFMAGWLVAETWQGSDYDPIADTISDLQAATAPHVWFPIVCFAAGGVGTFCFTVLGLRPALGAAGRVGARAPWMVALAALALGNSFPLIPCRLSDVGCSATAQLLSPGGLTDAILATAGLLAWVAAAFPMAQRLALVPEWRRMKPVMLAARVAGPVSFGLLAVTSAAGVWQGLAERILVTVCVVWILALALNLIAVSWRAGIDP
jgi:hypothetical protein